MIEEQTETILRVRSLSKFYAKGSGHEVTALSGVDLDIRLGERWGLIGPNGSGKSTLLRIIGGISRPSSGEVFVRGRLHSILDVGGNFIPELTGRENASTYLSMAGMNRRAAAQAIPEIERFADLGPFFDRPVKTYSDGMFVRLGFAVSFRSGVDLLLVDETLSAGDTNFRKKVTQHLKAELSGRLAMLMVSHNPDDILDHCTHCLWMEGGRIAARGHAIDVLQTYYAEMAERDSETRYHRPLSTAADSHSFGQGPVADHGNELLSVEGFSVRPPDGQPAITYDYGAVFTIYIEKLTGTDSLHPLIIIYDYLDKPALLLMPMAGSKEEILIQETASHRGALHFTVQLQAGLLTFGNYTAELKFGLSPDKNQSFNREAYRLPGRLPFKVLPGITYDYVGGTESAFVKPACIWRVETLKSAQQ